MKMVNSSPRKLALIPVMKFGSFDAAMKTGRERRQMARAAKSMTIMAHTAAAALVWGGWRWGDGGGGGGGRLRGVSVPQTTSDGPCRKDLAVAVSTTVSTRTQRPWVLQTEQVFNSVYRSVLVLLEATACSAVRNPLYSMSDSSEAVFLLFLVIVCCWYDSDLDFTLVVSVAFCMRLLFEGTKVIFFPSLLRHSKQWQKCE